MMLPVVLLALLGMADGLAVGVGRTARVRTARAVAPRMDFVLDMKVAALKLLAGSYDEAEVKAMVERDIARKPCVMYTTTTCPFCAKAVSALDALGALYTNIELDVVDDGNAIKVELAQIIGQTSVPAVFVGGKFVGGCNDGGMGGVLPLNSQGKLKDMLISAGALSATGRI
eukprot:CAMPEP_0206163164 /NCGR_PEP_ID=MMETSP1474-20131121/11240_1 /ASSEMBLY_ACC=CAM_ASM_001110 /TAXON_ID=97495 /ORGANISM="Imantonia sp., Strain RCC918" /LENGTH=171 /DNA_ID=CAMNT_0053565597 /DNA_START=26 /DNA_END=541 /DNA_ORIENTATION=-